VNAWHDDGRDNIDIDIDSSIDIALDMAIAICRDTTIVFTSIFQLFYPVSRDFAYYLYDVSV